MCNQEDYTKYFKIVDEKKIYSIAMPFLAAVVFFILDLFPIRKKVESHVKWPIFYGSMLTSISGLTYAYILQENMIFHGF